jgi:hypothetical protein
MPVLITTPFPTSEDTARVLGIPMKRMKEIKAMVAEIHASMTRKEERAAARSRQRKAVAKKVAGKKK